MDAFEVHKARKVEKAEAALARAAVRLNEAMRAYNGEVSAHERRGDGFFSREYRLARSEAVLARRFYDSKVSALSTARAESAAPTLLAGWGDA